MENFLSKKTLIGMVHLRALPGTPLNKLNIEQITQIAIEETEIYMKYDIDAIIVENMFDVPYLNREVGPEIVSIIAVICSKIKQMFKKPVGIQILGGCNKYSLAAAYASGCDFIRAEGFVFSHIGDEGFMNSDAGELLRYRKSIGADNIKVFTDIKKKHSSHSITSDLSIEVISQNAEFFLSDGIIVTGSCTGKEASIEEIINVKKSVKIPVLIGSGLTALNIENYISLCDGFIIGSYFKKEGIWSNEIDEERLLKFKSQWDKLINN